MTEEFHRIRRLPPYVFAEVNARQGTRPRRWRAGHHRPRHGQSGQPHARRISSPSWWKRWQDPRTHRYSTSRGHSGSAARARRILPAPALRRLGSIPETEVIATLGIERGSGQSGRRHHQPGRHHPRPQSVLPHPPVRFHHRRRLGAQSIPGPSRTRRCCARWRWAVRHSVPTAYRPDREFSEQSHRLPVADARFLHASVVAFCPHATTSSSCPTSLMPKSISAMCRSAIHPASAGGARRQRWSSRRCRRRTPCLVGGSVSPPATRGSISALARIKSYLDYGAFTPIQVAAAAALERAAGLRGRDARPL